MIFAIQFPEDCFEDDRAPCRFAFKEGERHLLVDSVGVVLRPKFAIVFRIITPDFASSDEYANFDLTRDAQHATIRTLEEAFHEKGFRRFRVFRMGAFAAVADALDACSELLETGGRLYESSD